MIEKGLRWLAAACRHHYRAVLLATLALAVLSLFLARDLRFDTEVLNLLPRDEPAVRTFVETMEDFGGLELLLVVVRIPEKAPLDPYLDFIDHLGPRLERLESVESVEYSLGDLEQLVEDFLPRSLLFLGADAREEVRRRLSEQGIRERVTELRQQVATPQAVFARTLLELDPLGLSDLILTEMAERGGGAETDWTRGYLLSRDHRLGLLVVRPSGTAIEADFARRLVAEAERACNDALGAWEEIAGPEPPPPPTIDLGGSYATIAEDVATVGRDMISNVATAGVGVLLLFVLAFRRVSLVGYAFLPLFVGLLLCFGFAGATFGVLSAASSSFAALLLGLALDFVIVSYGRYVEERRGGADLAHALQAMAGTSGRAVVTGAVTTAATFYAFSFTEFAGLRQMGILTGTGILLCMAAVLVLLPAMMAWSEDRYSRRVAGVRSLSLHAFGLGGIIPFSLKRPRGVLIAAGLLTLGAAFVAPRLRFEDDIRKMRPSGSHVAAIQSEVAAAFGGGFDAMMLVVSGEDEGRVLERVHRAQRRAEELVERGILGGVDSIADLIPPASVQTAAIEWLEANASLFERDRLWGLFSSATAEEGLRAEAFAEGIELVVEAGQRRQPILIHDLADDPRTGELVSRYVHREEGRLTAVLYLQAPAQGWNLVTPPEVLEMADGLGSEFVLTGANLLGERLRGQIRRDAATACVLGFLFVGLLLYLEYRVLSDTLLSLLPLAAGMLWMMAGMVLLGVDMNFYNIFVTTMIIGIGVDYGIHMVDRYREAKDGSATELEDSLRETGRAVILAAVSTTVGFGSLALSHFPGIRSIGLVSILGALSTALVAITVLPALFAYRQRRRPADPQARSPGLDVGRR